MTVKELIEKLQELPDKNSTIKARGFWEHHPISDITKENEGYIINYCSED